jgi:hypothetical protein
MLLGVQKTMREWTLTLPSELPLRELESQMDSWLFRERSQGSKPIGLIILYIIGMILKFKCIKWVRMTHLDIWNTSYGQKKGQESNWQFDSQPIKVKNQPDFLTYRWRTTYHWKDLKEGYNFASNLITVGGIHAKLCAPKVVEIPIVGNLRLPFGSPGTNCHLDVGLVERHKKYYKGEGGGFPQVLVVVSLVNPRLPVALPNTKSAQIMH